MHKILVIWHLSHENHKLSAAIVESLIDVLFDCLLFLLKNEKKCDRKIPENLNVHNYEQSKEKNKTALPFL